MISHVGSEITNASKILLLQPNFYSWLPFGQTHSHFHFNTMILNSLIPGHCFTYTVFNRNLKPAVKHPTIPKELFKFNLEMEYKSSISKKRSLNSTSKVAFLCIE